MVRTQPALVKIPPVFVASIIETLHTKLCVSFKVKSIKNGVVILQVSDNSLSYSL
jgi:hypothetical protein